MPVENEQKFILSLKPSDIVKLCNDYNGSVNKIKQGYINDARFRNQASISGIIDEHFDQKWFHNKSYFTWKYFQDDQLYEFEMEIENDEFKKLWKNTTDRIEKIRVKFYQKDVIWATDFLFKETVNHHYITIAECEMPVDWKSPKHIPAMIKKNIIYTVPRNDGYKWTNKLLADTVYCSKMLKEII
jgi:hypothetical protein